jgi:class 3 adenylate cyclase
MESNYYPYNYEHSFQRISSILGASRDTYTDVECLPDRGRLTDSNGFYACCSAVFVDIRDSTSLPKKYKRAKLARLYRAYISEVVAILNGSKNALEINIVGDGVWGVYNTPCQPDIDELFEITGQVNSLVMVLNYELMRAGYKKGPLRVGIGASDGRALMIKAGYSDSGINDVVYMGDVVNRAAKLAAQASKPCEDPIFFSKRMYVNLRKEYKKLVTKHPTQDFYTANLVDPCMDAWYENNCK